MNKIPNRQVICDVLMEAAAKDEKIMVLCSDSRGSASLVPFSKEYPQQFVEMGIAEQSLVSTAAGLARAGLRPFAASPACFLSTRSMEQIKVDVAYSNTNVKLIGISGGISYGALGMTHHSSTDIATIGSIPGMRVYMPSDRHQTRKLIESIIIDNKPAYIRVGRNPVDDVYSETMDFTLDKANVITKGSDIAIIACGEMVKPAKDAAEVLKANGIGAYVVDLYCIKPMDSKAVLDAALNTKAVITIEEHVKIGGMGAMVAQLIGENCPRPIKCMALPDEPVVSGKSQEVFNYYGLNPQGIISNAMELLR